MTAPTRYRVEEGKACIDIRLKSSQQLFDGRDPAPFRERDLDEDGVEYILGAAQEIPVKQPLRIVFMITAEPEPRLSQDDIREAVRSHFTYERGMVERRLRQHVRGGQFIFLAGLTILAVFLTLAEFASSLPAGHFRQILREGLVITGWVAMWRPLEVLFYDWWPLAEMRKRIDRLLEADISVRYSAEAPVLPTVSQRSVSF